MPSYRARSQCPKSRGLSRRPKPKRLDRSCSPCLTNSPLVSYCSSGSRQHSKYCECEECFLLYDVDEPLYTPPSWLSMATVRTPVWTAAISLLLFAITLRGVAFTFPLGLFGSSFYSVEMGSIGSRVLFTVQQHIWSMVPLMFGNRIGTVTFTLHLLLNTLVLSTLVGDVYMRYIASVIITSTLYTLLGYYSDSPSWRLFFSFPRRIANAAMTVLCIKYAMDTKVLTGVNTN